MKNPKKLLEELKKDPLFGKPGNRNRTMVNLCILSWIEDFTEEERESFDDDEVAYRILDLHINGNGSLTMTDRENCATKIAHVVPYLVTWGPADSPENSLAYMVE